MNEIKCPKCHEIFQVDNSSYANILNQVRDQKFDEELENRLFDGVKLAEANLKITQQNEIVIKDKLIAEQKAELDRLQLETNSKLKNAENEKKLSIADAIHKIEKEKAEKENEIIQLKAAISNVDVEKKLAINEAVQKVEKQCDTLANNIKLIEAEKQLSEKSLNERHAAEIKAKDVVIKHKDE